MIADWRALDTAKNMCHWPELRKRVRSRLFAGQCTRALEPFSKHVQVVSLASLARCSNWRLCNVSIGPATANRALGLLALYLLAPHAVHLFGGAFS